MSTGLVHRCATCGAPLDSVADRSVVACAYCGSENRLVALEVERARAKHARFAQAAGEARQMAADLDAKGAQLLAAYEHAQERAMVDGDAEAARDALRHFEGYLRLQYAPTIHMYRSWDPDDPQVVDAMRQIDDAIDQALSSVAAALGVPYVPTRERLSR